jgi:hypothetical protein
MLLSRTLFEVTTQYALMPMATVFKEQSDPTINVHRRYEPVRAGSVLYLSQPMLVVDPSRFADLLYRHHHSHGETTARPLYPYKPMPAVDPSRFADRQYRHHHSYGESSTETSLISSEHMKFVWKLIEWENGEATMNSLSTHHAANNLAAIGEVITKDPAIDGIIPRSYIETKTRHILHQPLLFIKNNWLSSMSISRFIFLDAARLRADGE